MEKTEQKFHKIYGVWPHLGWGVMIVLYTPTECEYVHFTFEDTNEKQIINQKLWDEYNSNERIK